MSSFLDTVRKRRSIREYLDKPVPREMIDRCVEAARFAPSACNSQGWRFIIAEGAIKDELVEECLGGQPVPNRWASKAPVMVIIAFDRGLVTHRIGAGIKGTRYDLIDVGIAGEHFVLQAAELGLGTCWIGWFRKRRLKRLLGIPSSWEVPAMLTLGFAAGDPPEKSLRSLEEIREYRTKR